MKIKSLAFKLTALILLALLCVMLSCDKGGDETGTTEAGTDSAETVPDTGADTSEELTEETAAPEDEKDIVTVYNKKFLRSCLDWGQNTETLEGGATSWWKTSSCEILEAGIVSVFPYYHSGTGLTSGNAVLIDSCMQSVLDETKAGLDYSHSKGVKVISALPMVLLNRSTYETLGADWRSLCATNLKGSLASDSKYGYACINNPLFQEQVRKYTVAACKAGYDGMFFDGSPYSYGLEYNCCCEYCQATWKEYSLKYLGKETEIPVTAPSQTTKNSRILWKMRVDIYINFIMELWEECKAINPDFGVWPNLGINGTVECYYTLHGLETTITEFGSNKIVNPGYDSTLYMYRQYEAENPDGMLISQFNSIVEQATPLFKWKTAYVEALAAGGSLMMPVSTTGTEKLYPEISKANSIIDNNTEAFESSASGAKVAVVYSWSEMNYCHLKGTGLLSYNKNTPRKAVSALAQRGIPFDYLMPENCTQLSDLERYDVLVFAEFGLMSEEFEKLVCDYVNNGGKILVLGSSFATYYPVTEGIDYEKRSTDLVMKLTGTALADINNTAVLKAGEGQVCVVKDWVSGESESTAVFTDGFCNALETLGCYDLVRVDEDITGNVETTLRRNADGSKLWLHLITYNSEEVYDDKKITVTMTLRDGETVTAVRADSVTLSDAEVGLEWEQTGNKLTIKARIGLWTMISVEKQA